MIAPTYQITHRRERRPRRSAAARRKLGTGIACAQINAQSLKSVIPSEAKESPGEMLQFGTAFREIATGFALAMTAVIDGLLRRNRTALE